MRIMKLLVIISVIAAMLVGCGMTLVGAENTSLHPGSNGYIYTSGNSNTYPRILYYSGEWAAEDGTRRRIFIEDGYVLSDGHSYDVVETSIGFDLIFHFEKRPTN